VARVCVVRETGETCVVEGLCLIVSSNLSFIYLVRSQFLFANTRVDRKLSTAEGSAE